MADQKISAMPSASTLTGAELVPLVQSGVNVQTTLDTIRTYDNAYGAWSDSTDQTGSITAGTAVTYNTQDVSDGVTLVSNSRITVPNTGKYNLQFSLQFKNIENAQHEVVVWLKVNGSDLGNSSTIYTVPARKNASIFGYNVAALTFLLDLNANDYVETFWLPSIATLTIENLPASVSPAYPAVPSAIVQMIQIG